MSTKVVGGGFNPYIGSDAISAARTLSQGGVSGSYGETVLSVTGAIVAEQFKTALASASIIFPSGSTRFGNDDENDTHHFRGSIFAVTASVIAFGSSSVQFSNEFPPGAHKADGTANNLWGSDVTFFVSGSVGGKRTTGAGVGVTGGGGVALFGGDLVTSGTLFARDVTLWSGETRSFVITSSAGDAYISSSVSNKDMIFMVNDGGTMTEVFRLDGDVSALKVAANKKLMLGAAEEYLYGDGTDIHISLGAGGDINVPTDIGITFGNDGEKIEGDGTNLTIAGGTINLDSEGDITLDAGGADIVFKDDGTEVGSLNLTGTTNMTLRSKGDLTFNVDDDNIYFQSEGTEFGFISSTGANEFALSASVSDKHFMVYASVSGSSKEYARFGAEQVLILSGGGSSSPHPIGTDTNFFVSGSIGKKDSSVKGTSIFGGDVVTSGTLYVNTPTTVPAAAFGNLDGAAGAGNDTFIWVSGSIYTKGGSTRGTSIFGGDVVVSGALDVKQQTVTLTNNTTTATIVSGTLGAIQFDYGKTYHTQIRYGIKRNRDVEGGQILMTMAPNGSSADVAVISNIISVDAQNPGITFSADVGGGYARLNYTCINSGSHHATMNYAIEQEFTY